MTQHHAGIKNGRFGAKRLLSEWGFERFLHLVTAMCVVVGGVWDAGDAVYG
jgi:hypothetical protein